MSLDFPSNWRFDGFEEMPKEAHWAFVELIKVTARGAQSPKRIFEIVKRAFGSGSNSTDAGWAAEDMEEAMRASRKNGALYVDSLYTAFKDIESLGVTVPRAENINAILERFNVNLIVEPPCLKTRDGDIELIESHFSPDDPLPQGYVQGDVIGSGGFGTVYRVTRNTKLGKYDFAMKVFEPSSFITNVDRAFERFLRELRSLERLQHRAIITLLEAGYLKNKVPYLLMPLIEGLDVSNALKNAEAATVLDVFDEILNGLEFAHGQGIFHRDLKPSNIIVRNIDRQPFILDFGAAFIRDQGTPELTTTLIGTDAYVPDEVRTNHAHRTPQQDVYACGKLIYQVIMGKLPQFNDYEPIEELHLGFAGIDIVIEKAIAAERRRYRTIRELRAALSGVG